jgi:glycosyltransferase involved in cell wall biosynthesis
MSSKPVEKGQKKAIILWNYLNWGGAQIYLLSVVKHAPADWSFKLVVPRRSPAEIVELFKKYGVEVEFQDVVLDTDPAETLFRKLQRQWRRIHSEWATYRYIKRQKTAGAVLHVETAPWQSWIFIRMLTRRIDVFITMHNSLPAVSKLRRFIWRQRLQYVSGLERFHLFTSNEDTKNSLKGWVRDDFWPKIAVTYTCVDPTEIEEVLNRKITKTELRGEFGVDPDKFVVLCVGQFIDRKGRKIFLEAARRLCEKETDVQFLWLTQTALGAEDHALIESYGLGERFRLVRSETVGKERADVLRFFLNADAFALPSYVEGLPIALLEAMALGVPSISTAVNAIPEAVINERTGLLIAPGRADELARAIKRLKDEPELREKLAREGSRYVIEHFDERVCARTVLKCYEEALGKEK